MGGIFTNNKKVVDNWQAAEILFETFCARGLCIGVQAVLALYASFAAAGSKAIYFFEFF